MAKLIADIYGKDEGDVIRSLMSKKEGETGVDFREVVANSSSGAEDKSAKLLYVDRLNPNGEVMDTRRVHSIRYVKNTNNPTEDWAGGEVEWCESADNISSYAMKDHTIRGQNVTINGVTDTRILSNKLFFNNIPYVSNGYDSLLAEKGKQVIRIPKNELGIPSPATLSKTNTDNISWKYEGVDYGADFDNHHKYVAEINIGDLFKNHKFNAEGGELFEVYLSARIKDTNRYAITNVHIKMHNGNAWNFETWLTSPNTTSGNTDFSYNGTNVFISPAYYVSSWARDTKIVITMYSHEKIPFKNQPFAFADQGETSTLNVDENFNLILKK